MDNLEKYMEIMRMSQKPLPDLVCLKSYETTELSSNWTEYTMNSEYDTPKPLVDLRDFEDVIATYKTRIDDFDFFGTEFHSIDSYDQPPKFERILPKYTQDKIFGKNSNPFGGAYNPIIKENVSAEQANAIIIARLIENVEQARHGNALSARIAAQMLRPLLDEMELLLQKSRDDAHEIVTTVKEKETTND